MSETVDKGQKLLYLVCAPTNLYMSITLTSLLSPSSTTFLHWSGSSCILPYTSTVRANQFCLDRKYQATIVSVDKLFLC